MSEIDLAEAQARMVEIKARLQQGKPLHPEVLTDEAGAILAACRAAMEQKP